MIEIANRTKEFLPLALLKRAGGFVLEQEERGSAVVSVAIVGEKRMRALNKTYRKKEYVANVLSFEGEEEDLGEVVLCARQIRKDAREYGITFREALCRMLVHGLLHLLSYDHEGSKKEAKRMERKETIYHSTISQYL